MRTATYTSSFIKKENILGAELLTNDIHEYSSFVDKAILSLTKQDKTGEPVFESETLHTHMTHQFSLIDYYATAVNSQAKAVIKAAKEMLDLRIEDLENRVNQIEAKIETEEKKLQNQQKIKASLITRSVARKNGEDLPKLEGYQGHPYRIDDSGQVKIVRYNKKLNKQVETESFPNEWEFEMFYLDPLIKRQKAKVGHLKDRLFKTRTKLEYFQRRKEKKDPPICFVSKQYFRKQKKDGLTGEAWAQFYKKRRTREMMIPGRKDAAQGNYVFRYDTESHMLTVVPMRGKQSKKEALIKIPNVVFQHGQQKINEAVNAKKGPRKAVAWSIRDCGSKIQVRCHITDELEWKTYPACWGCIGIDMNYDNISASEIDYKGNLIWKHTYSFNPVGKSSNQRRNMISEILEKIFKRCAETQKPLGYENIKLKYESMYQNHVRNYKVANFSYSIIEDLIESKSYKYHVETIKVNPAYTSQIGKMKYMKRLGLSVHQSASYVIARRTAGFTEKIPPRLQQYVPNKYKDKKTWIQWKQLSMIAKNLPVHSFYGNINKLFETVS